MLIRIFLRGSRAYNANLWIIIPLLMIRFSLSPRLLYFSYRVHIYAFTKIMKNKLHCEIVGVNLCKISSKYLNIVKFSLLFCIFVIFCKFFFPLKPYMKLYQATAKCTSYKSAWKYFIKWNFLILWKLKLLYKKSWKKFIFTCENFFLNEKLKFVDEELRKKEKCSRNLERD